MAPKASPISEYSSHASPTFSASSITSTRYINNGGLELSSSSHSIAKHNLKKKGPIIRVVHVFAPKLIKTDAANFRRLVQKLTGNHSSNEEEQEEEKEEEAAAEEESNQAIDHVKQLELRYPKEREATIPAYSSVISSSSAVLTTQFEDDYEHPFLHYGSFQASNHVGLATRGHESIHYVPGLARIEERDEYFPANQGGLARSDEGSMGELAIYGSWKPCISSHAKLEAQAHEPKYKKGAFSKSCKLKSLNSRQFQHLVQVELSYTMAMLYNGSFLLAFIVVRAIIALTIMIFVALICIVRFRGRTNPTALEMELAPLPLPHFFSWGVIWKEFHPIL